MARSIAQCHRLFSNCENFGLDTGRVRILSLPFAIDETLKHLATMNVQPQRPAREGRSYYRIAFISNPDGNLIELMQICPESAIYRA